MRTSTLSVLLPALFALSANAAEPVTANYGAELEGFDYPFEVHSTRFESQGEQVQMRYMDVRPEPDKANGRTAMLLHGKNYCAATWESTIVA
ncbi:MAG: alpha/beta fold hydrolase, partial [Lysobacter sp.]